MIMVDRKKKYELENQVIAKMFREDKRFRTRIIPNKKKAYNEIRGSKSRRQDLEEHVRDYMD